MYARESIFAFSIHTVAHRVVSLLMDWWRTRAPEELDLATATDHADLERRMRALERAGSGPTFETSAWGHW